jgi:hypothetical protein
MQDAGEVEAARLSTKNMVSDHYTQFQHVAYVIDYPENWQTSGTPDASVTFYPEGGLAGSAMAYGVTVSGFQPKARSNELQDAVQELVRDIKASNPGMREYNSPQVRAAKTGFLDKHLQINNIESHNSMVAQRTRRCRDGTPWEFCLAGQVANVAARTMALRSQDSRVQGIAYWFS